MDKNTQVAILVVVGFILYRLIDKVIEYFWNRTAKANYLTVEEFQIKCAECHKNDPTPILVADLREDIKEMKVIILRIARKTPGVETGDIERLVQ